MNRITAILTACVIALFALTGCTSGTGTLDDPKDATQSGHNVWVEMDDGRVVYCYIQGDGHGGPSCDWANAK